MVLCLHRNYETDASPPHHRAPNSPLCEVQVDIFSFQNDAILSSDLAITSREMHIEIIQKEENGSHWRTEL